MSPGMPLVKRALYHSGLLALARMARTRVRGLILRYHALTDDERDVPYAAPDICLPARAFELQMAFVKRHYRVLSLDEVADALAQGGALPPLSVAITFDDGYADNHRLALPILRRLGLPATVYVATAAADRQDVFWVSAVRALVLAARGTEIAVPGIAPIALPATGRRDAAVKALTRAMVELPAAVRRERLRTVAAGAGVDLDALLAGTMMTWAQVKELAQAGWTIGAHTVNHQNVAVVEPAIAETEIMRSRDAIADAAGTAVCHFCYPNTGGRHRYFSPEVADILRRNGFRSATTSVPGALKPGADPFLLPRLGVSPRLAPVIDLAAAIERQRLAA
jgi:peptidoglycan/xylan/chitin deacetylase (PgdA/CDA1 family)